MKASLAVLFVAIALQGLAQPGWDWAELSGMPEPVANNAVTHGCCGDTLCAYSFTGIDSTLTPSGIHLKAWRYNTVNQSWTQLPHVPDSDGKIAAGASTVNNKIYVIGGHYVEDNFSEVTSDDIHVFNPKTNSWEAEGANISVTIDDQVQVAYRDSLILVITGWSDNTNVNDIQIYNPEFDSWEFGTETPNLNVYKAFGASGEIVGDAIFYLGGVNSTTFTSNGILRRGIIDPIDPTTITWSQAETFPYGDAYRAAAATWLDRVFWIGGAGTSYNFDALLYANGSVVPPEYRIATYYSSSAIWEEGAGTSFGVMNLRGIAKVSDTSWIICGGMTDGQVVWDRTFLLQLDPSVGILNDLQELRHIALIQGRLEFSPDV